MKNLSFNTINAMQMMAMSSVEDNKQIYAIVEGSEIRFQTVVNSFMDYKPVFTTGNVKAIKKQSGFDGKEFPSMKACNQFYQTLIELVKQAIGCDIYFHM